MLKAVIVLLAISFAVVPLFGSSYYPVRLDDPKAVYLTPENFSIHGDGIADDSEAVQQALNKVQETTEQGILFVPAGRYRLTKTIYIWPGIRLIGFGANRPTFVLTPNTQDFQKEPAYMFFFAGDRPGSARANQWRVSRATDPVPDANPGTFYSAMSNIDIEIQDGNPGAVG
ncbi:MAG TPA: glycosyl hydrolase family 28-related protein, partial [Terriglobales bacterium]|nr:glycosyl hydrolase family 28-related protein [Terriglobales bacterium]